MHLLDIWEKDGLDAAVMAWKKLHDKKQTGTNRKPKKDKSLKEFGLSNGSLVEDFGISKEDWIALKKEIEADTGTPVDADIDWDD